MDQAYLSASQAGVEDAANRISGVSREVQDREDRGRLRFLMRAIGDMPGGSSVWATNPEKAGDQMVRKLELLSKLMERDARTRRGFARMKDVVGFLGVVAKVVGKYVPRNQQQGASFEIEEGVKLFDEY